MRDLTLSLPLAFSKPRIGNWNGTQKLNITLLAGTLLLSLAYLFTISSLGTKGYEIKRVETQLQQLENEQKILQIQSSDLQSINQIQAKAVAGHFVPVTNVTYIKDANFALK